MFTSTLSGLGPLVLPSWSGVRVMMMPFLLEDVTRTVPQNLFGAWGDVITKACCRLSAPLRGVAYATIDEALVRAGEHHRRPGLHVDGEGAWGGTPTRPWATNGMGLVASHTGCAAYAQSFEGTPGDDGDCEALRPQCKRATPLRGGQLYACGPLTVHESLPMLEDTRRSFLRISMPSAAPWFEGYTESPVGVKPIGPVLPRRTTQMAYRTEASSR